MSEDQSGAGTVYAGVGVYNVNPGNHASQYTQSMLALMLHDRDTKGHVRQYRQKTGSSAPSFSRTACVLHFLNETSCEYMYFVDSDIEQEPDTLDKLLETAEVMGTRVVTGLYCSVLPEGLVGVAWKLDGTVVTAEDYERWVAEGVRFVEVERCGAGSLLIHRDVLLKMYERAEDQNDAWFGEVVVNGRKQGEDFTFCHRARACGFSIYLDLDTSMSHIKTISLHKGMLGKVQITGTSD